MITMQQLVQKCILILFSTAYIIYYIEEIIYLMHMYMYIIWLILFTYIMFYVHDNTEER